MIHDTPEQKMKMCPQCLSDNGNYKKIDQELHEKFGLHYTRGNSWRCGPNDVDWKGNKVKCI